MVDEAFADLAPELSLLPHLGELPAVVLRSFGKFFGLAGLRLGFVGRPAAAPWTPCRHLLGDWPVSNAALVIGAAALGDGAWQAATRRRLGEMAASLRGLLAAPRSERRSAARACSSWPRPSDAAAIHHELAKRGVWTRAFARHPQWLRFGLPPDGTALARLDEALTDGAGRLCQSARNDHGRVEQVDHLSVDAESAGETRLGQRRAAAGRRRRCARCRARPAGRRSARQARGRGARRSPRRRPRA